MNPIIAFLARQGLSERTARLGAGMVAALAAFAILAALWGLRQAFDWFNDRKAIERHVNKANAQALEVARSADDAAASQAARDDRILELQFQEVKDAISHAESGQPGAVAVAHSCQRLRRHGYAEADLPPACRGGAAAGE